MFYMYEIVFTLQHSAGQLKRQKLEVYNKYSIINNRFKNGKQINRKTTKGRYTTGD